MEYESGGSLLTQLEWAQMFSEKRAQFYAADITLALQLLYKHRTLYL
jgi:serine/threonine protein kinase